MIFNALMTDLLRQGQGYVNIFNHKTGQRAFADDLTLTTSTAEGMSTGLRTIASFCTWSGARPNLDKSEIAAYDFGGRRALPTDNIKMEGQPLAPLNPETPFRYLGFRFSLTGSWDGEMQHILSTTKELALPCQGHKYLLHQAVTGVHMIQESRFRYSAALA